MHSSKLGLLPAQFIDAYYSMFSGPDETEIRCEKVRLLIVRKDHDCMCPGHHIQPPHKILNGEPAIASHAIADGSWGTCYVCLPCLRSWWNHCENGGEYCDAKLTTKVTMVARSVV